MTIEVKAALESLHNPLVYNQALTDCRNLLNLSLDTLLAHFQQWLWSEEAPQEGSGEFEYYLQLAAIEESLVSQRVIYDGE
ncbi:hypothetical protein D3C86_1092530 [compost metagenome]